MKKAVLIRQRSLSNDKQTCGRFILVDEKGDVAFHCASLELPWLNNQRNVSCIPSGTYEVTKVHSPKFGDGTLSVNSVQGRSHILIHPGNYTSDIEGCILLGERFADLNKDNITDVINSKVTVESLKSLADEFTLTIIWI